MIWMRMPVFHSAEDLAAIESDSSDDDRRIVCHIEFTRGFAEWKIKNSILLRSALPPGPDRAWSYGESPLKPETINYRTRSRSATACTAAHFDLLRTGVPLQ